MTRNSFIAAAAAAVLIISSSSAIAVAAGLSGASADESAATSFADAATDAGTAVGIVNQCRNDAAPIQFAFRRALDEAKLDPALRQSLWQRFRAAETSTLTALAGEGAISCADTNLIIQDTIHKLEMPLS